MTTPKVSIIVPIYNVEAYIEKCMCSLFSQSLKEIEYILIDDKSSDTGLQVVERVLKDYPEREPWVRIIRHDRNRGVGATRQEGLEAATGEYVIHCDPDDFVEVETYEKLYNTAKSSGAEIVVCDFYTNFQGEDIYTSQAPECGESLSLLQHISGLKDEIHNGVVWNKLIKRDVALQSNFTAGINYCEDVVYLFRMFQKKRKITHIPEALYHYIARDGSLIKTYGDKACQSDINLIQAIENVREIHRKEKGFSEGSANPEVKLNKEDYARCCNSFLAGVMMNRLLNYDRKNCRRLAPYFVPYKNYISTYRHKKNKISLKCLDMALTGNTGKAKTLYDLFCMILPAYLSAKKIFRLGSR